LNSLYAICDEDKSVLSVFKKKYPEAVVYSQVNDLIQNSQVDAVVVAAPAESHYSLGREVLLSGKDLFVEKPIALTMRDAEELVALADKQNKILMVGHILEYHPAIVRLNEMVKEGELGNIQYIYSNRLNLGKFRTEENILWSFAPHDISVILGLLDDMPEEVYAHGGNYLNPDITDVTITSLSFAEGVKAHIFVSWLHPYKEQKLIIIGDKCMVMFDDVAPEDKLFKYGHQIDWVEGQPFPRKDEAEHVKIDQGEPLKLECRHFLDCITKRENPKTDGENGLRVLEVLEACQQSLRTHRKVIMSKKSINEEYFVHESSILDEDVKIGRGTKIWHFSHILSQTKIGNDCTVGQNVMIGPNVTIGNNVKIQNNVSVYEGVDIEDDVFCGPSMVFTNVVNPRSHLPRKHEYKKTLVKKGASLGANATIICGITIGQYAFIGAGAVVNKDIPDYALVYGVPAKLMGWMCYCGTPLDLSKSKNSEETASCSSCGREYKKKGLAVAEETKGK
jgi:UDP-2-acetamido-3-amino-2,3-dideoxy-glucuronate N-acetyltransferase